MSKFLFKCLFFSFNVFVFSSPYAQTFVGVLEILQFDNFKKNQSTALYRLLEGNNVYELVIKKSPEINDLLTGDHITVDGELVSGLKQSQIRVKTIYIEKKSSNEQKIVNESRKIVALLVNFNDKKVTDLITPAIVDAQLYTSPLSVQRNYILSSNSQLTFTRDPIQPGIFVVNLNYDAGALCEFDKWSEDAKAVATQAGINLGAYRHHMFILPGGVTCPWSGVGYLGCGINCKTWVIGEGDTKLTMAHELGHNLGMHHAATDLNNDGINDNEYGDYSCVMGNSGYTQINAPHRDQMHWFDAFPKKIATVTATGQYIINSLDTLRDTLKVLKIVKKDQSGTYYVSYRTNTVPFGMGSPYANKINIHRTVPGDNHSYFITALGNSETFTDENNGIVITSATTSIKNSAIVNVAITP